MGPYAEMVPESEEQNWLPRNPGQKSCDGNLYSCNFIPKCGVGASCKKGACKCDDGLTGNGQQCQDSAGELVTTAGDNVDITIDTQTQYFVFTEDQRNTTV